jgi:Mg2+ and Co2+ transporter CorA
VITARLYVEGSTRAEEVDLASLGAAPDDRSILWVDASESQLNEVDEGLGHSEAVPEGRDGVGVTVRADWIHATVTALRDESGPAESVPLRLGLGRNIVVTIHDAPIRGMADPIAVVAGDPRFGRLDAGRFAGLLLEGVLHGYDAAVDEIETAIDRLDEFALRPDRDDDVLDAMVRLRRRISDLRRWLAPQRAVVADLTRPVEDEPSPIGLPDATLLAHLERTLDSIERAREQLLGTFDIAMTRTGQRTNDVMKTLTVVSAVLLPSVVIAGVMGMNFQAGLFDEPGLFYVVVAAMALLAIGTLLLARWRRWI